MLTSSPTVLTVVPAAGSAAASKDGAAASLVSATSCWSKRVQKTSSSLGIFQWGMTLDKQWCGNGTTISSQDKQCYYTAGTNWSLKEHSCNTQTLSSGHGKSWSDAHWHWGISPFSQDAYPQIGVSYYADGRVFPWTT